MGHSSTTEYRRAYYEKNRDKLREYNRKYREEHRDKCREKSRQYYHQHKDLDTAREKRQAHRLRKYGVSPQEYKRLFLAQGGRCAICKKQKKRGLFLDHDHTTGKPRGLLCSQCNTGIGMFGDSLELVERALAYLHQNLLT